MLRAKQGKEEITYISSNFQVSKCQCLRSEVSNSQSANFEGSKCQCLKSEVPKFEVSNFQVSKCQCLKSEVPKFEVSNFQVSKCQGLKSQHRGELTPDLCARTRPAPRPAAGPGARTSAPAQRLAPSARAGISPAAGTRAGLHERAHGLGQLRVPRRDPALELPHLRSDWRNSHCVDFMCTLEREIRSQDQ